MQRFRQPLLLVGLVPAVVVLCWLLVIPFSSQTQSTPVRSGRCGPAVRAVFRSPNGDDLRNQCALAADGKFIAAGVVAVCLAVWILVFPRVQRLGRIAVSLLGISLAGIALILSPFSVKGDRYITDDGVVWRETVTCPAPWASIRYINVDSSKRNCATPSSLWRLGVGAVAVVCVIAVALIARHRTADQLESTSNTQ